MKKALFSAMIMHAAFLFFCFESYINA